MNRLPACFSCTRRGTAIAIALAVLAFSGTAAADHTNLEEGLPVEVTDAYPLEYLGREVQSRLQYRYTAEGAHETYIEPRFEFGIPYNGQIAIRVPMVGQFVQDDERFDLGRVALDYMYNLNQETLSIPAFSIVGGVEAPDTRDGGSFDPFARILISKMIPGSTLWHRVHLNGMIQANVDRKEDERSFRYVAVVGYDFRLSATMIGVVDAVRDQPLRNGPASNFGEIGVRLQVTPLFALAFGGGAGASDEGEPVARGTAAFQWFAF
jgi:hypothetical protein